jgi:hypothetical protein
METLLQNDFIEHYSLQPYYISINSQQVSSLSFAIADMNPGLKIFEPSSSAPKDKGIAAYLNPNRLIVAIINYEKFIDDLPRDFQCGKERCDAIVYTKDNSNFILNELKNKKSKRNAIRRARKQLSQSLKTLIDVPAIKEFVKNFNIKRCCYFNTMPLPQVQPIKAIQAFNRINNLSTNGFQKKDTDIESLGFEFWEYFGSRKYNL